MLCYVNNRPGLDSSVVRMSALGAVVRRFAPRPRHTKGDKNGSGSFLADTRNKGECQEDTRRWVRFC